MHKSSFQLSVANSQSEVLENTMNKVVRWKRKCIDFQSPSVHPDCDTYDNNSHRNPFRRLFASLSAFQPSDAAKCCRRVSMEWYSTLFLRGLPTGEKILLLNEG